MLTTHPQQHQQRGYPLVTAVDQVVDCHQHLSPQEALPLVVAVVVAASMLAGDCNMKSVECVCIWPMAQLALVSSFAGGKQPLANVSI